MSFFSMVFSLFLLMDPIGNIPIYISLLKSVPAKRQRFIIFRESIIALVAIILFYFLGDILLDLLNISHQSVRISGGIILFLIALKLIFPNRKEKEAVSADKEPFIVPLAIPLVAGPAVLATVMLYARKEIAVGLVLAAIVCAWVVSTILLLASTPIQKILGPRGIAACERLMGLILVMIAVQMFLDGYNQTY